MLKLLSVILQKNRKMTKYKIFAALNENTNDGLVWVTKNHNICDERPSLKIRNSQTGRNVFVEVQAIDSNFIKIYNGKKGTIKIDEKQNNLIASAWYRNKLGIAETQEYVDLEIVSPCIKLVGDYHAGRSHPQSSIRLSNLLGLIGLVLGILSLIISIL